MQRKFAEATKIANFQTETMTDICENIDARPDELRNEIAILLGPFAVEEDFNLNVQEISPPDHKYSRPMYPLANTTSYLFQLTGQAILRTGGWKQRQSGLVISPGEIIQITGNGKRAIEGNDTYLGIMAVVRESSVSINPINQELNTSKII